MMEIEYSKTETSSHKRKAENSNHNSFGILTPLKKTKLSPSRSSYEQLTLTEKAKIYLSIEEGYNVSTISKDLKKNRNTVANFLRRALKFNDFTPRHKLKGRWPKGGSKLNERHKSCINKWLEEGKFNSSRQIWRKLNSMMNMKRISYNPINNYIKTLGGFVRPTLKPTISEKNKEKRLSYCRKHSNFNFKNVLFTDESIFQLNANTLKVFVKKGHRYPRAKRHNPNSKIMVWGGISHYGKTALKIIEDNLDGERYRRLILRGKRAEVKRFMGSRRWWFQQDQAPCHRQKATLEFIKKNITNDIFPHPAQSPDLNPIELVWARMKVFVEKNSQKIKMNSKKLY